MRIALFTNEYPPNVYGGAGVHVEYLTRELARAEGGAHHVQVLSFGDQHETRGNLQVRGVAPAVRFPAQDPRHARLLDALVRNLAMVGAVDARQLAGQVLDVDAGAAVDVRRVLVREERDPHLGCRRAFNPQMTQMTQI